MTKKRTYQQPQIEVVDMQAMCPLLTGSNPLGTTNSSQWQEDDNPINEEIYL